MEDGHFSVKSAIKDTKKRINELSVLKGTKRETWKTMLLGDEMDTVDIKDAYGELKRIHECEKELQNILSCLENFEAVMESVSSVVSKNK